MIGNITIGRYYNHSSLIHNVDPRTKIIFNVLFAVSLFFLNKVWMFIIPLMFLFYELRASELKFSFVFKGIWKLAFPFAVLSLFVYFSQNNWEDCIITFFRLFFIVLGSSVLTYTTTPSEISQGLYRITKSTDIAMILCIALRYLPILCNNALTVYQAQKNRGADYSEGSLKKRIKLSLSLFVPLFASSFRMASDLGTAMDARLYSSKGRTALNPLKFTGADFIYLLISLAYLVSVAGARYVF